MRSEDLLKYLGEVDDKFIGELMDEKVVNIASRRAKRGRWLAVAACFALIVLCSAVLMGAGMDMDRGQLTLPNNITSIPVAQNCVVMIDVNPSIKLEINDRSVVVSAEAMNDDAAALMEELQIKGMNCDDAVEKTVAVLQEHEYITNLKNSVLLTVVGSNEAKAEDIRRAIVDIIQSFDENRDYDLSILSQIFTDVSEYAEIAESYHMSEGRAALIQKTCDLHEDYDFATLAECSIQTINQVFEYIPVPDFVQRMGTAAATVPEDFKCKLNLDGLTDKEIIGFAMAIADFYDKLCVYYDEAEVANHIVDIVYTENDNGIKRWTVLAENFSNGLDSLCAIIKLGDTAISDWLSSNTFREIASYISDVA